MNLISVGIGVIFIGFLIVFLGIVFSAQKADTHSKFSFVGFIGPIPFGFGNDKQWVITSLVVAIVFMLVITFLLRGR